jgi:hypothetical protein
MKRIFVPTISAEDWKNSLAAPEKHWRTGYSARSLAYCWEAADGFPPEVVQIFSQSGIPAVERVELLLALPEYKVPLPPLNRKPSQNDLFVLAKDSENRLMTIMVEGKVEEPFGQTLDEKMGDASAGLSERLAFMQDKLGLPNNLPPTIRYQLLHRTVSALLEAERFSASSAVMLVHSFSVKRSWFDDYANFLRLFDQEATIDQLVLLKRIGSIDLYTGWVKGDTRFLNS